MMMMMMMMMISLNKYQGPHDVWSTRRNQMG